MLHLQKSLQYFYLLFTNDIIIKTNNPTRGRLCIPYTVNKMHFDCFQSRDHEQRDMDTEVVIWSSKARHSPSPPFSHAPTWTPRPFHQQPEVSWMPQRQPELLPVSNEVDFTLTSFDRSTTVLLFFKSFIKRLYIYALNIIHNSIQSRSQGAEGPGPQFSRQNKSIRLNCTKLANLISLK